MLRFLWDCCFRSDKYPLLKAHSDLNCWTFSKNRTKESSPDLFSFFLVSAGHDMDTDTDRATSCWCNFKAPSLQKVHKMKDLSKHGFYQKAVWRFQSKKAKTRRLRTNPVFCRRIFSGLTALTAFNRNLLGVNSGPSCYRVVDSVLVES